MNSPTNKIHGRRHSKRMKEYPLFSITILVVLMIMAFFPGWFAPHSPYEQILQDRFTPPFWESGGSAKYLLGADSLGRDILSRIIYGSRISLFVACLSLFFGGLVGTFIGMASGYFGGRVDAVVMRFADSTLAFPIILFAFLLAVSLGPSLQNVVISISIVIWARYARIMRGEVLSIKERDFIKLAKVAGCSSWRIMFFHIFPNVVNTLVVLLTLQFGWIIIVEASLSFLGAGIPPPTPAWGPMMAEGRQYIATAWWVVALPGLVLMLTVLSFNRLGDWLRDWLDPKLRNI